MGRFKRFCYIVFALANAAALAMLVLPWRGPWTKIFNPLFAQSTVYAYVLFACLGISAIGLIVILFRAIFTPAARKSITMERTDGGSITLGVDAIASQARYLLEEQGDCEATKVHVSTKGSSRVVVSASVRPRYAMNLATYGEELQENVMRRLNEFSGGAVESVSLHFLEPENPDFYVEPEPIAVEHTVEPVDSPSAAEASYPAAEPEPLYPHGDSSAELPSSSSEEEESYDGNEQDASNDTEEGAE